jgi:DNA-directed RNA polymerase specialized sigma24 family protein
MVRATGMAAERIAWSGSEDGCEFAIVSGSPANRKLEDCRVNRVEREQVRAAIQQLPLEFREIIILREYEELSYLSSRACRPRNFMKIARRQTS